METPVFLAVLATAVMHAGWNALVKVGLDRFSTVLLLSIMQSALGLPLLPFLAQPSQEAWIWIAGSACLHCGYKIFLINAYAHADLSQAYPMARGSAPLIVTVVSLAFLGTSIAPLGLMAVGCISAGLLLMAARGSPGGMMRGPALFYALGTAAFTADYTLTDGYGARIAGTPLSYTVWLFLGDTIGMILYALIRRGRAGFSGIWGAWRAGTLAGGLSLGSNGIAVWAFTVAPIALVSALRESSILFAILIAAFVMRERVGPWRWASGGLIAAGVALMKL